MLKYDFLSNSNHLFFNIDTCIILVNFTFSNLNAMKKFKIALFFLLLSTIGANAQYGYTNGGPGVIRNNGIPSSQQTPKEPTPEEIEKNRTEKIDSYMSHLKTDLTLDELQYIAIKNELTSSSKRMDIVVKSEYSDEEKTNEIKSIQEKMEKTILSYLNTSQKEKYALLKVQKPDKKEEKKKKKKEKEKESETKN